MSLRKSALRSAWALAIVLAGATVAAAVLEQIALTALAGTLAFAATVAASRILRDRDVFHPGVIFGGLLVTLTVGRVIYVLDKDAFGPEVRNQIELSAHEQAFALGVMAQLLGAALFVAGTALARRREIQTDSAERPVNTLPLAVALVVGAAAWVGSLAYLVSDAGSLRAYIDALGYRQVFFDDRGWLLAAPTIFPGLVLAWLAVHVRSLTTGNRRAAAAGLVVFGAVLAASTGTRSILLYLFLIPALVLIDVRVRRIPVWIGIAGALVAFIGAGAYREAVRDNDNPAVEAITESGAKGVVVNTFASPDAHLPDPVAVLTEDDSGPKWGTTIANSALAPVPRRLWAGKPTGANEQFTEVVSPDVFEANRSEYAITLAGELYWNFWWPGLAVFAVLGLGTGLAYRRARARPGDPLATLAYAGALGFVLLLLRGDFYNSVIGASEVFVPALALLLLGRRMAK